MMIRCLLYSCDEFIFQGFCTIYEKKTHHELQNSRFDCTEPAVIVPPPDQLLLLFNLLQICSFLTFPQNLLTFESSEQMCQIFWFTQFFILLGWPWNIKYQEQLWDYWSKNLPLGGGSGHLCHRVLYPPTLEPSVERRFGVALIWHQCSAYRGKTPTFWQTRR